MRYAARVGAPGPTPPASTGATLASARAAGNLRREMRIEHLALWTDDLERARRFYETHFGARAGAAYRNPRTDFRSYFLTFGSGARLELMQRPDVAARPNTDGRETLGLTHFALALGSERAVDETTARLQVAGVTVSSAPRRTGDGYYESCVLDPDGNRIELTV